MNTDPRLAIITDFERQYRIDERLGNDPALYHWAMDTVATTCFTDDDFHSLDGCDAAMLCCMGKAEEKYKAVKHDIAAIPGFTPMEQNWRRTMEAGKLRHVVALYASSITQITGLRSRVDLSPYTPACKAE